MGEEVQIDTSTWYEVKDKETQHSFFFSLNKDRSEKKEQGSDDKEILQNLTPACADTSWVPSIEAVDAILKSIQGRNHDLHGRSSMISRESSTGIFRDGHKSMSSSVDLNEFLSSSVTNRTSIELENEKGKGKLLTTETSTDELWSEKQNYGNTTDTNMIATNPNEANRSPTLPRHDSALDMTLSMQSLSGKISAVEPQWRVKIHIDSGQIYYSNDALDKLSWENPFVDNSILKQLGSQESLSYDGAEKIDEDMMIGYYDVPDRSIDLIKSTPAAISAKASLLNWMKQESIKVTQEDSICLQWPEYLESERNFKPFENVSAEVILPHAVFTRESDEKKKNKIVVTFSSEDTVKNLLQKVFHQYELETGGNIIDEDNKFDYYIFKNNGTEEYMFHPDYRLGLYTNAITAWRKCVSLKIELIKLTHAEQLDITTIFSLDMKKKQQESSGQGVQQNSASSIRGGYDDFLRWKEKQALLADYDLELEKTWSQMSFIPVTELRWPLRVSIIGIEKFPFKDVISKDFDTIYIELGLYYNGDILCPLSARTANQQQSQLVPTTKLLSCEEPHWPKNCYDISTINICDMPPQTRIGIRVMGLCELGEKKSKEAIPLAGVAITAFDYANTLVSGKQKLRLWPSKELQLIRDPKLGKHDNPPPRALSMTHSPVGDNIENNSGILHISFDTYELPVKAPPTSLSKAIEEVNRVTKKRANAKKLTVAEIAEESKQEMMASSHVDIEDRAHIEKGHSLKILSLAEKKLLWRSRDIAKERPSLLPKFMQSVNWIDPAHVQIAHKLLCQWKEQPIGREAAYLEMLDIQYQDPIVREYAIWLVSSMEDSEFKEYVLQLVQVLKYEPYHDSPLARLLIKRAIENPLEIGHRLYWNLKAEMFNPDIAERFGVILSVYLQNSGLHRVHLWRQLEVNTALQDIAKKIKEKPKDRRIPYIREEIEKLNKRFDKLYLCLNPKLSLKSIVAEKCKVMSSKKLPLWLVFENSDPYGERFMALFKEGDDLRQDMMTLQMLRIMDKIWLQNKLDLKMNPYDCVSTGDGLGMIEAVKKSVTTAYIQQVYGGKIAGAFLKAPIDNFLREFNTTKELYVNSVANFVHTCAGYCVATYVLGIGDRHADNIMVTEAGHLFHIDFGHFLGNFKKKFGINRERTAFVFTPEMHYVMMRDDKIRPDFTDFQSECCTAYNLLRQNANLFINLFKLMVPAAMPELMEQDDINYMVDQLDLDLVQGEANLRFVGEINKSLENTFRRFDNWIHNLKHG